MKKLSVLILVAALATTAFAVGHVARGHGTLESGATFDFRVAVPANPMHPNGFRFEDTQAQVTVMTHHIVRIDFDRHSVQFVGRGMYNGEPAMIFVNAFDGGSVRGDGLRLMVRDMGGAILFTAHGRVTEGGIFINHIR